jgi:DHA2 family multidrug resistance protein-like MFS transporter
VYASIYASRLTDALPTGLPTTVARTAHNSVGAALAVAGRIAHTGDPRLAAAVHDAASSAFFQGFDVANYVAAGVAAGGAVLALWLLPAYPTATNDEASAERAVGSPAPATARS